MSAIWKWLRRLIAGLALIAAASAARAQTASPNQIIVSNTFFYMSDSSTQGGDALPGGTTTYMIMSAQYNAPAYYVGAGLTYHSNKTGESQAESGVGLKLEFFYPGWPLYFEYVPFATTTQTFTNRSIKSRSGSLSGMGLGVRTALLPWLFFDTVFRIRTATYTKEDGIGVPDSLTRTEKMPYLGFGVNFPI